MLPDNKPQRRKIFHSYESLELQRSKQGTTAQQRLDQLGYRKEAEYKDSVSHLAW